MNWAHHFWPGSNGNHLSQRPTPLTHTPDFRQVIISLFPQSCGLDCYIGTTPAEVALYESNGPLWYRGWALGDDKQVCADVDKVLQKTGTKRMIMGHTPDFTVRLSSPKIVTF